MARPPQMTGPTLKVLAELSANPSSSGAEIAKATKLASGTLYPLLIRLEKAGWVDSQWETGEPSVLGRPRRRFYRLTGEGQAAYQQAANELQVVFGRLAWN